ncbi:MAG: virginiamycin B lyase family protein [Ktedonobacteraceae bacterium]
MRPRFHVSIALLFFISIIVYSSTSLALAASFTATNVIKEKAGISTHTTVNVATQSQTDLPSPSWWSGICDTNNYFAATGVSAYTLPKGASTPTSYRGVLACGPRPYADKAPDHKVYFFKGDAVGAYEWECVELSMRFMYLAYGIKPYSGNGWQVVDNYKIYNTNPILQAVPNNGSSKMAPQPGDILSYKTTTSFGHTSVVIANNVDSNGNGTIIVMEQNMSSTGKATLKVGTNANNPPWVIGGGIKNWLHHTVDLTPQSASASASVEVTGTGFAANEQVNIKFDGTLLSTVAATSNGTVSTTITIPAGASLGTHHIQLVGQTSAFSPKTVFYVVKSSSGIITEFPVPTSNSLPQGITLGPDGNLWFTEYSGNKIGRITPTGTITEYPIPTANSSLTSITSGPDGNLWFTEYYPGKIGRITPIGTITEYSLPANSLVESITSGPDGNLWFTESYQPSQIGRITPTGTITEYPLPGYRSFPFGITSGPDGNLWFAESLANQIGRITPTGTIKEYPTPTTSSSPQYITSGPDGNLWFTEYDGNKIGKIIP